MFKAVVSIILSLFVMAGAANAVAPSLLDLAPAPSIQWKDLNGKFYDIERYRGHIVLVHFWASWCVPCRTELPKMTSFIKRHPDIVVLPFSLDSNPENAIDYVRVNRLRLPLMFAPQSLATQVGVRGVPATIVFDRDLRRVYMINGEAPWQSEGFYKKLKGFTKRLRAN